MTRYAIHMALVLMLPFASCSDSNNTRQPKPDGPVIKPDAAPPPVDARTPDTGPLPDLGTKGVTCTPPACPDCVSGKTGCAKNGPFLAGTCCARGDNLSIVSKADGNEVVDVETDGTYVVACGGFGASISDISTPGSPKSMGNATQRCQRIAIGPTLTDGTRVFYLAHHGDSWVTTPTLSTVYFKAGAGLSVADTITDAKVLFEGLLYHGGKLYVAAHEGGIRSYDLNSQGVPKHRGVINTGIKNAWKLAAHKDRLFVADQGAGLHVFSLAKPLAPARLHTVATTAAPRDVVVDGAGKRAYLAMGGGGVDFFDISDAKAAPKRVGSITGLNSAQAVAVSNGTLAVAAWNHTAVYDADTLTLLGTERVRAAFEQDLGVAAHKDLFIVGEWEGLHLLQFRQGLVAPDLFINQDIFTLDPEKADSRAVLVRNLGFADLQVKSVKVSDNAFTIKNGSFDLAPGKAEVFEFSYKPPIGVNSATITVESNDPDPRQAKLQIPLQLRSSGGLNVGDSIDSSFGFLDPSGAGQVSGLKSKVTILAYFALF